MPKTNHLPKVVLLGLILLLLWSCDNKSKRFELMKPNATGVVFSNELSYTEAFNPYTYRNFYNGAGVALGDINNDGLIDIYFTGNLVDNALYLNRGDFKFEDITETAGVACENIWSSGATFVDINQDGWLDLYVCKSGMPGGKNRHNELFINQKDNTFKEASAEYGLNITGLSVQAAFFDYDLDGDLDCYLLNNSMRSVGAYDLIEDQRNIPDTEGNRLLENRNGFFVNVSEKAGIYSSKIGFGLGITLSDFNNDLWPDLFISNDFFEKDYLYINNQKGGFDEMGDTYFNATSMGSMGADAADIDNDLNTDLMVTEMLPETLSRKKLKASYENWDKHELAKSKGYGNQCPRNVLQRNMGEETFAEISRIAGLDGSEWSWAALFFDMDNDGLKDLYISNGIHKDLLDRDYLTFMANDEKVRQLIEEDNDVLSKLIDVMPSAAVPNGAYKNKGSFQFENARDLWGFETPSFSNGSAYGDLDNDGDLDLVVNNINAPAFVYKNNSTENNYVQISLKGFEKNTFAIGGKVIVHQEGQKSMLEQFPSRGFQSAISNRLHFGLGKNSRIDSIEILWPDQKRSVLKEVTANQHIQVGYATAIKTGIVVLKENKNTRSVDQGILNFTHKENGFVDFNQERLLPQMFSNEGPVIIKADLNGDEQPDFFFGGAKDQASELWLSDGEKYSSSSKIEFEKDAMSEDTKALFMDVDNDGDKDLYVGSSGKAYSKFSFNLHDRIYINHGNGRFEKQNSILFSRPFATGALTAADFDNDGDIDIFVGERYQVETYGKDGQGYILRNDGAGNFTEEAPEVFSQIGMLTDAKHLDVNKDGYEDLIVVGEWMSPKVFINTQGTFIEAKESFGLSNEQGLWATLEIADLNADGHQDLVLGNIGENSFYKKGMKMFVKDFDGNGTEEQIMTYHESGADFPILDRDELFKQIPSLKKKYLYYKDYASANMTDLFGADVYQTALIKELRELSSAIYWGSDNDFTKNNLAPEIQYANVSSILLEDTDNNGTIDIVLGGNQSKIKPQFGPLESSNGWILKQQKNGIFDKPASLGVKGEIRSIISFKNKDQYSIILGINNDSIKIKNIQ
ncbi:MAG: VCBS repeat-containing protein [Flavobacteriaceae bacterium]|nr:VCBS repeat-containing protein [Flavobacteriaceae bacterium]